MPYQIVTDPKTGKVTTVVTGKVYEPKEGETPSFPAAPTPMDLYEATRGFTPQGMLESGVKAAGQAAGAGFAELQRTGDLGKAVQAGGAAYSEAMQQPAMLAPRVAYNAARDLTQSVLGNLPAAGSRKPGQPDSPILGVIPPLPRFKSTGPVEDVATGFLQGAMAWIPAARAVGLVGRGLTALPGVASVAQGTRTAAAFMEGAGPVVPLLPKAPTVGKIAVQAIKASLAGAPTGALVDVAGFTPGQQTTVGQVLDWVEKQSGTPLHGMVTDLLKTKPGDTEADARWKEGVGGLMVMGPVVGNAIEAVGYLARAYVHRASIEGKAAPVGEPDPVATAANRQANVDVATARQQAAQANVDSFDPKPDPTDKKATRAWNRKYKKLNEELTAANNAVAEAQALQQQQPVAAPVTAAKPDEVAAADQALAEANARFEKAMREMAQPSPGGIADPWATPTPAATAEVAAPGAITPEVVPPGATGPGTGRTKLSEQFRAGMENLGQSLGEYTRTVEGMMARQEQSLQQRAADLQQQAQELGTEAAAIKGAAAPAVKGELPDTRGQGQFFHGTAQEIKQLGEGYYESSNIYGQGFYATDDLKTAGSYTKKNVKAVTRGGGTPSRVIYRIDETQPIKFYDLDAPVSATVRQQLEAATKYSEATSRALDELDANPEMSLAQVMDEIRANSKAAGESRDTIQEVFDGVRETLQAEGYGGFTHIGGRLTKTGREHQVKIYWDPANQISLQKTEPGALAAPVATAPAKAMSAADEAVLRRALQGKSPEEQTRIIQQMQAGAPPEPPRPPAMYGGPEDPEWAKRWAELNQANQDKLASGEVSLDDLHRLNTYQKLQSASGNQVYTADTEDLAAGMAAMAQTTPDIATRTGFEALSAEEKYAFNQRWFDSHGMDWGKNYEEGLKGLEQSLVDYELGALNRAMSMADKKMIEAQYAGARWLNSVGEPGVNASEQLAQLVTAASSAQRMLLVIDNVRRRWGQLGQEMQMRRNYDIPAQGSGQGVVEAAINEELQAMPDAFNGLTDKIDPELTAAAQGGEITPNAEIAADALAKSMMSLGVEPKARLKLFRGAFDTTKPLGPDGLLIFRSNNLISSGLTAMTNLGNGLFNLGRLTTSQALGAALHLDFDRAIYAAQMWGTQLTQIANASRLAGHAMKAGQSLFNLEGSTIDAFARMAKEDAAGDQMLKDPKAMTGWSVNTWNMSNEFAQTRQGQLVNKLWQIAGTGASRLSIGLDTFNAALSGYSYERFRHLPRGMELAVERGLPKFSSEAWAYANKYADARTEQAISDVVINGKTLADAALESPDAKKFMDAVNFTDDIYAQMETRTPDEGYRIGKAKGLKGEELDAFAKKYVDEGLWYHKVGDYFVTPGEAFGSGVLGRIGSAPGLALEGLSSIPVVGPVVRLVQPFQRVPANIIKSTMRSTPAAVFVDTWWRDVMSNDVGTRQRAVGEVALGSSVLTMMMLATTMGYIRINGGGPLDPRAREKWLQERQMPYSIQIWDSDNGRWDAPLSLRAMEPFATLFGAIGDYADYAASMPTETRNRAGGALLMSLVRMQTSGVLSKTYFQGINELYEAAFDPNKIFTGPAKRDPAARWLQRVLASMVPYSSALRAARRQVDPYARTVEPSEGGWMGFWQETWDEIRNATPGLSQDLPALRDWSLPGAPPIVLPQIAGSNLIPEDAPFLQALWQFTPMAAAPMGQAITDPVQQEMFNLHGKGSIFSGPRASDFGPEMRLTPMELAQYQEMFASVRDESGLTWHDTVSKLLSDPNYVALPDQASSTQEVSYRAAAIQREIMRYKELAKAEFKATTAKGQVILQNEAKLQGQRDEMNYYERYGVPGASSITTPNALTAPQQQAGQPWSITPGKR